jgi:uncharacterized RDD family membrane protein YckC
MPLSARGGEPVYFCQSCGHHLVPHLVPNAGLALVAACAQHAGLTQRVGAGTMDLLLAGLAAAVGSAVAVQGAVIVHGSHTGEARAVAWIAALAVLACYQPLFWARSGRTPGMQLFGIRLSRPDGSRVGPARAAGRLLAMVPSALPLGAGFARAARDPRGQAWHDRIADTVVVSTSR